MTAPSWFQTLTPSAAGAVNSAWQESTDAGASYHAMPNLPTVEPPAGTPQTGLQRYRQFFTVPPGLPANAHLVITAGGDIFTGGVNIPAAVYLDGFFQGVVVPLGGPRAFDLGVPAAGIHTFELWIGQDAAGPGGLTNPSVLADLTFELPCDCCPTGPAQCATGVTGQVYPCLRASGALEWYDSGGVLVPSANVIPCAEETPLAVSSLTMTEIALGDDPGLGERMCNVVPAVTGFTGYSVQAGPCYDGSAANGDSLTWAGPLSSVSMSYESGGSASAGAALVAFSAPSIGTVTWPANGVKMVAGEVRQSNPLIGGGYATITYLSPAGAPANGAPSQDGGANIRLGPAAIQAYAPYHFRIDFWGP